MHYWSFIKTNTAARRISGFLFSLLKNMKKPFRFVIIDRKTKKFEETNITPSHVELFSYVAEGGNSNISHLTQVKDVYEDTRYEAKLSFITL